MAFYVEITKQHYPGKNLWAPVNEKIWHWKLLTELKPGDIIFHVYTKGKSRILGMSVVKDKYKIRSVPEDSRYYNIYKKRYYVELKNFEKFKNPIIFDGKFRKMVVKIGYIENSPFRSDGHLNQIYFAKLDPKYVKLFKSLLGFSSLEPQQDTKPYSGSLADMLTMKKQIIFYGPPGTSKTFQAKKFAVDFLEGEFKNNKIDSDIIYAKKAGLTVDKYKKMKTEIIKMLEDGSWVEGKSKELAKKYDCAWQVPAGIKARYFKEKIKGEQWSNR